MTNATLKTSPAHLAVTGSPARLQRSVSLKVTITPELHQRLKDVAAHLGQAPATVASMAIGQYVAQMHRSLGAAERFAEGLVGEVGPEIREQLKLLTSEARTPARKGPARRGKR
jgi:predicted DNA-binding protein